MKEMGWKRYAEAPEQGWLLIYTRKKVVMEPYASVQERDRRVNQMVGEEILELHLFDREKEYRCLKTRSRRHPNGWIETVSDFPDDSEHVYSESVLLTEPWSEFTMTVLNHHNYDANGIGYMDNYRLYVERRPESYV